ncbi:MAG TPA: AAA family ATPase [bacterium]|jgi:predicted AAA+ superfamily ATPase|nr:AAA family ATPase [bacterium]HQI03984.1 AAA family ATPase [bacterium]HQN72047.1 AAA family ATPase [bacterium]HQO91480.1 AAA family ATPase [bacterium]HRQ71344.1 AAA family ATPase [bacterium]
MIERRALEDLKKWKDDSDRKPLILRGIRQVGKTSLLKRFGEECFEDTAYFNFDSQKDLSDLFKGNITPHSVVESLGVLRGSLIKPGKTLLILDEIQECSEALNSLKYFCEEMRELHVATAGSFLGIALSRPSSFPVGKVDFLTLYPVSLKEFISANGEEMLALNLANISPDKPVPKPIFEKYSDYLRKYFMIGGMPEAVAKWVDTGDIEKVEKVLKNIINAYEIDFSKHAPVKDTPKISEIWNSLPNQLSKENKKFVYTVVRSGARAREYEDALNWLKNAGIVHKINKISKPHLPVSSYCDPSSFKIYLADIGMLRVKSNLSAAVFLDKNKLFTEFKGAMSENFVLNEMISSGIEQPFYWTSEATAEVEFIIQSDTSVIPVEVKSGTNVSSKSMTVYRQNYKPQTVIRTSLKNIGSENGLLSLPLFAISEIKRILKRL